MKQLLLLCVAFVLLSTGALSQENPDSAVVSDEAAVSESYQFPEEDSTLPEDRTPPTLMIGAGVLTYYGELSKTYRANNPITSRIAFDITFIQPVTSYLDVRVFAWGGKISANERTVDRNLNFQTSIFGGGIMATYNFDQLLKPTRLMEPFIGVGFEVFEFNSKTDLVDQFGNTYYYWKDGSIRNVAEGTLPIDATVRLQRDYVYETDLRKADIDGFGTYNNFSFAIPVTAGFTMHLAERWDFQVMATYHFTFTDYLDGVTGNSQGERKGDAANDNLLYIGAGLSYDLTRKHKSKEDRIKDKTVNFDELGDSDGDGVIDLADDCMGTPEGVEVDARGCPLDGDKDNVGNYKDDELNSAPNAQTDSLGVTYTEQMINDMYNSFIDSTGEFSTIENETYTVQVIASKTKRYKPVPKTQYGVSIGQFKDAIPSELVNNILSIPDIQTHEQDGTVILTVGKYATVEEAKARQRELSATGITGTDVVSMKTGGKVSTISGDKTAYDVNEWKMAESKDIVYRVQVGAFTRNANEVVFKYLPKVIKISSDDGYTRYFTGTFPSYGKAAVSKINIIQMGFEDAFVVALQGGKKIPLSVAGATLLQEHKEKLKTQKPLSPTQRDNVKFRVQLGSFKKQLPTDILEKYMELGKLDQIKGSDGYTRYVVGSFSNLADANTFKRELLQKGFDGAFVVGEFNGELIPASKAIEMLKR